MKKAKKHADEFEAFGKEFIQLLPVNQLQKMVRKIEAFDGETPKTLLSKIQNQPIKLKRVSDEEQKAFQDKLLKAIRNPAFSSEITNGIRESIRFIKESLRKDDRHSLLLKLVSKADEKVEFICLPFLKSFSDFEQNFILFSKPIKLLEEIKSSVLEKRANLVVELVREISEPLYRNYLEAIWRFSFFIEAEMCPKVTPTFGALVNQSANRLKDFPGLVEAEMKVLRNSFVHKNFEYFLQYDSFVIWDKTTPKVQKTADEIVKIVNNVTSMCVDTFPLVAHLYLLRNFYLDSGLLEMQFKNMPALTSGDALEISKAEEEISTFVKLLTEPMVKFFQTHQ
ncbi:MAG: hypothetical protein WA584_09560 [Pyrinomonadaceae bacterium]